MKAEVKLQWIAALLSGDYAQGLGRLRTQDDEYCCLGVLCDVSRSLDGLPHGEWTLDGWRWVFRVPEAYSDYSWSVVPDQLASILEVNGSPIHVHETANNIQGILQGMNDNEKKNFEQIARFIDEEIPFTEDELVEIAIGGSDV